MVTLFIDNSKPHIYGIRTLTTASIKHINDILYNKQMVYSMKHNSSLLKLKKMVRYLIPVSVLLVCVHLAAQDNTLPVKFLIQPQFDYAGDFRGGIASVKVNGKWGYIKHPRLM